VTATDSTKTHAENDVRAFVYSWYRLLDQHAPLEEYLPLLAGEDVEFIFPEATLKGTEGFAAWYRGGSEKYKDLPGVTNLFFDEVHELKVVDISITGSGVAGAGVYASLVIVVKWEAHRWTPPKPKSDVLRFDAWQRWVLTASAQGRPVIRQYIVDKLEPLAGTAAL
jgi:hypothetical protein